MHRMLDTEADYSLADQNCHGHSDSIIGLAVRRNFSGPISYPAICFVSSPRPFLGHFHRYMGASRDDHRYFGASVVDSSISNSHCLLTAAQSSGKCQLVKMQHSLARYATNAMI